MPVYGITPEDPIAVSTGDTLRYFEGQEIILEPGEQVESELAFPLETSKLGLRAVKVRFRGRQRKRSNKPYEWATFFYVDPRTTGVKRGGAGNLTADRLEQR
jgi:hypothetical protein